MMSEEDFERAIADLRKIADALREHDRKRGYQLAADAAAKLEEVAKQLEDDSD